MEAVEDHPRVRDPRPQRFLPARRQVDRHQLEPFAAGPTQPVEERLQRLRAAPLAGPHHPLPVVVDLEPGQELAPRWAVLVRCQRVGVVRLGGVQEGGELNAIDAELTVVIVGSGIAPADATVRKARLCHVAFLGRLAWMAGQRRADKAFETMLRGVSSHHAASLRTAANSSGRDHRDTVDNGSTNRKSASPQTSAVSSNSETKARASGPAAR